MSVQPLERPTLEDVRRAQERLAGVVQPTPLDPSHTFSTLSGNRVFLKLENLQKTGSFKLRGAYNKIAQLSPEERERGVIAASAGNHAQGVAFAATSHQSPCVIVMPEGASLAKISATQGYGATVVLSGTSYDDAYQHALELQKVHDYTFVHAFDDPLVIAGQGTIGLEILQQLPEVDAVVVPVGGGGLAAGVALAVKSLRPSVRVYGVEAANAACFRHALDAGRVETIPAQPTIADGIAVRRPGELTFDLVQRYVDDVVTVEEEEIARTLVLLLERSKLVVEGAAAAALAACVTKKLPSGLGNVVVVLSGGNIDVTVLSRVIEHGLADAGRYLRLAVHLYDRPGALRDLLDVFAALGANVVSIQHHRVGTGISLGQTEVEIDLETRDANHVQIILERLSAKGYTPKLR
ncbi:threonine ammonia-lyase [Alicyclobacillus macrosporangiidus]|jgi:threonine dehydratase|uniref:L-threonine dehydratase catabolic TdcB n=1 Tax=Alicyclobacillus macrosporangiidus TaxID=392015 RepID=A0A1I7JAW4_9BACL|nr:threonine ammonia-lyase [Alicyclobacillus macrosporangiidus]SFU82380.1 threonine dehydratase [Alicyclobacillus macrosporangiidus]